MRSAANLDENEFVQLVLEDSHSVIRTLGFNALKKSTKDDIIPDEHQFYIQRVGFCLAHTLRWCKQLTLAVEFMGNFDHSKAGNASKADHLIYNIENYIIRLNSILDRILQLVNALFHIGMNEEHVSYSAIVSNDKIVHRPEIQARIKELHKFLRTHAQARHALVHKHSLMDDEIDRIELFYLHDLNYLSNDDKWKQTFKIFRANNLRKFSVKKTNEYTKVNQNLIEIIDRLMVSMLGEYKRQKSRIANDIYRNGNP
jgi:Cthe_2314-like HEPN